MKRKLAMGALSVVVLCLLAAVVWPVFSKAEVYSGPSVPGYLMNIYRALEQYASDNDGRLPRAETWMVDAYKYAQFGFPDRVPRKWRGLGPVFFAPLSESKLDEIEDAGNVPLVFLSETRERNAYGDLTFIAPVTENRPGYAVLFADGTIELMPADWRFETIVIQLP